MGVVLERPAPGLTSHAMQQDLLWRLLHRGNYFLLINVPCDLPMLKKC